MYYSILVMSVTVHVDLRGKLQVCLFTRKTSGSGFQDKQTCLS